LKKSDQLPDFVNEIKTPNGLVLAANSPLSNEIYPLCGDVDALRLVDLDNEGLGEYKEYLSKNNYTKSCSNKDVQKMPSPELVPNNLSDLIERTFLTYRKDLNSKLSIEDAESLFYMLNSQLGRFSFTSVRDFFTLLDVNNDGCIDLNEFKRAFISTI
jgi:hypothetical protein